MQSSHPQRPVVWHPVHTRRYELHRSRTARPHRLMPRRLVRAAKRLGRAVAHRAMWGYGVDPPADINPHETRWGPMPGTKWNAWLRNDDGTASGRQSRAALPSIRPRGARRSMPDQGTARRDHGPLRRLPPGSGKANVNFVHRVYTFAAHGPDARAMVV